MSESLADGGAFNPVAPHPCQTVHRLDVAVLLHEDAIKTPAPLVRILQSHIGGAEKRAVVVCEAFDCEAILPELLSEFEERLNLVIVECPGFAEGKRDRLHELARMSGAQILAEGQEQSGASPLGRVERLAILEGNRTTFTVGDDAVTIDDSLEVMTVHATEDGAENPEERCAREAAESGRDWDGVVSGPSAEAGGGGEVPWGERPPCDGSCEPCAAVPEEARARAAVWCGDCTKLLCEACDSTVHAAERAGHVRDALDDEA